MGFRPFVYRLASQLRLGGTVGNDPQGAFIEVEGPRDDVDMFAEKLQRELPPLASITSLSARTIPLQREKLFQIEGSDTSGVQTAEITPDVATCDDCLREMLDETDRRYRYPFINCTNCGPRYSIVRAVPYDRANTTMSRFVMCPACQAEYDDPTDRRFHAQPNACPACGPKVWLTDRRGRPLDGDAISLCAKRLREGEIVAIKGIGGFHLACRADDDDAVARLRALKNREVKPLAMMVPSPAAAEELALIDDASAAALTGPARPIVLVPKRPGSPVSRHVAPQNAYFGVMLPYAPLHWLLFAEGLGPLVMTSGNPTAEPLCSDNEEAIERLGDIAEAFLLHDRDIERRVDDSIVMIAGPGRSAMPIRSARGCAPEAIRLTTSAPQPVLAVGGELKSAVCLLAGDTAVLSEHLGELSNPKTYRNFVSTIERFKELLALDPQTVACDMHPDYAATRYARKLALPCEEVQHHHAHVVSCMADNGITGRVIGVACDGTGYGTDGNIWGCEVFECDEADFHRAAHLRYYPLLGADAASLETWRPAAGLLHEVMGDDWPQAASFAFSRVDPAAIETAGRLLAGTTRLLQTSSLGRLFDAVAFLLGVCDRNRCEAQAAMAMEAAAAACPHAEPLSYSIVPDNDGGPMRLDVRDMMGELVEHVQAGRDVAQLAKAFHETIAVMLAECVGMVAGRTGLGRVVLSGGCFANRILLSRLLELLPPAGLEVFVHRSVPTGDGGIALGQAVAAACRQLKGQQ